MSFDVFFWRFDGGATVDADESAVLSVIEPLIAERRDGWARIGTTDGEADVYGLDHVSSGLMINHASGREIWDVMFELARTARFVVVPVGCPTCVVEEAAIEQLPDELRSSVAVIRSGNELLDVVLTAK